MIIIYSVYIYVVLNHIQTNEIDSKLIKFHEISMLYIRLIIKNLDDRHINDIIHDTNI